MTDITEEDRKEIQRSFNVLDVDKNGRLSLSEVVNGLHMCGLNPTKKEAKEIFDKINKSGDGSIDYQEYEQLMVKQMRARKEEDELFMDAFIKFDKDGNGHIDFPELQDMFCSTGDKMTHEQVDDFFREADVNKDGKIIYKVAEGWLLPSDDVSCSLNNVQTVNSNSLIIIRSEFVDWINTF